MLHGVRIIPVLFQFQDKILDDPIKSRIFVHLFPDPVASIKNGGMVSAAKLFANLWQGRVG
jgi:hypothetical protein